MAKNDSASEERRRFLAKAGRFAIATPPAVALMLSATSAHAATSGSTTPTTSTLPTTTV